MMKSPTKPTASVHELLGGARLGELQALISRSRSTAEAIIAHGSFVRNSFKQGNMNSAPEGSTQGTLPAAGGIIRGMHPVAPLDENAGIVSQPYFGENIRAAWRVLRPLFRGK